MECCIEFFTRSVIAGASEIVEFREFRESVRRARNLVLWNATLPPPARAERGRAPTLCYGTSRTAPLAALVVIAA